MSELKPLAEADDSLTEKSLDQLIDNLSKLGEQGLLLSFALRAPVGRLFSIRSTNDYEIFARRFHKSSQLDSLGIEVLAGDPSLEQSLVVNEISIGTANSTDEHLNRGLAEGQMVLLGKYDHGDGTVTRSIIPLADCQVNLL